MIKKEKHASMEGQEDEPKEGDVGFKSAGGEAVEETPDLTVVRSEDDKRVAELEARLEEVKKQADENYDRYLRAVAELDNFRKRSVREKAEAIKYGNENLLRDILPLLDGIDRALQHADNSRDFDAFKDGLQMLRGQFFGCLKKYGVEQIDSLEKDFDPNLHEAVMQVDSDQFDDNKIVDEFEKGYMLNGRLLRPAKVSVCKKSSSGCEDKKESET